MKHYKKRTIALVLASVITVVGAFGAENYKNSLMSLKFDGTSDGAVNVILQTKANYEKSINPIRKDAVTYVIMLPETDSAKDAVRELSGNVESVDIKTMPYTTNSSGYTKITIKTLPNTVLNAQKAVYVPEEKPVEALPAKEYTKNTEPIIPRQNIEERQKQINETSYQREEKRNYSEQVKEKPISETSEKYYDKQEPSVESDTEVSNNSAVSNEDSGYELIFMLLGILVILLSVIYLYIKGKNKMVEILGEQPDFDVKEEKEKNSKTKQHKIKSTINSIDRMYQKPIKMPIPEYKPQIATSVESEKVQQEEPQNVVVDLDELFQEKTKSAVSEDEVVLDDENDDLTSFLEEFNLFDETETAQEEVEEQELYNEELFEKYIHDGSIHFSESDVTKINELLSEISDDTMKNISDFVVSNPIETKKPSKMEILENFVTTYTVNQNISFSKADIDALYKLINVELDEDFIKDLRTNPSRVSEMRKEIKEHQVQAHKHSELLTLNVKDMLPDLSEALKKQGGKRIESEAKPEVIYYSEGYEVSKLKLNEELPDLTAEINNKDAYVSRPSDEITLVESGYDFDKLSVSDLPDLNDALNNPDKYQEKPKKRENIDEKSLLENISNVTFKPFYDGSEEFEIINDFSEEEEQNDVPSVSQVQEELNQFKDFEVIDDSEQETETENTQVVLTPQKPLSLNDDTFYDLDKKSKVSAKSVRAEIKDANTEELLKLIETQQQERRDRQAVRTQNSAFANNQNKQKEIQQKPKNCIFEGVKYDVIDTFIMNEKAGCYLVRSGEVHFILGYIEGKILKLKEYSDLKIEKIEARAREQISENIVQYLVRAGQHKFVLNVSADNMEYVMDLC